ncbi:hypothetical protein M8853_07335 [Pasteurella multocida]|uniref:hypothetical protein n=1 Tax=Pasteurella multocida TaxID=747 RepID=UPI0007ECF75E|nr:hypothetical protein [Pasteurella multocida]MCL7839912.1 hypothetical protein [Pasteurella multocida]OBP36110.1 hypothetical protein A0R69_00400 [Pasteurella multocida subsp. multocida]PNM11054.1 hypothetical protein A6J59_010480 [Pasteurella multocida]URH91378.1 hypothetical protein M8853_07335 [Pasteurella multocida]HDR1196001.1 hypothetical protein [Pasteurella multocida]
MMKMKQSRKSILGVLTLSTAVVLAGCQNTGDSYFGSQSSLSTGEEAEFFSDSGWNACAWGAAGGAVLGAGVALLSGKDAGTAAAVGVAGAAAGCGALMGTNYYLEKQRKAYAKKEDRLNAYIAETRKNSDMVRKATAKAKTQLDRNNKTLVNLNKQLKSGAIQQADAKKQLAQIDADIKAAQNNLASMKKRAQTLREVASKEKSSGLNVSRFEAEIASLNKQIATYERLVDASSKQRSAIQIG